MKAILVTNIFILSRPLVKRINWRFLMLSWATTLILLKVIKLAYILFIISSISWALFLFLSESLYQILYVDLQDRIKSLFKISYVTYLVCLLLLGPLLALQFFFSRTIPLPFHSILVTLNWVTLLCQILGYKWENKIFTYGSYFLSILAFLALMKHHFSHGQKNYLINLLFTKKPIFLFIIPLEIFLYFKRKKRILLIIKSIIVLIFGLFYYFLPLHILEIINLLSFKVLLSNLIFSKYLLLVLFFIISTIHVSLNKSRLLKTYEVEMLDKSNFVTITSLLPSKTKKQFSTVGSIDGEKINFYPPLRENQINFIRDNGIVEKGEILIEFDNTLVNSQIIFTKAEISRIKKMLDDLKENTLLYNESEDIKLQLEIQRLNNILQEQNQLKNRFTILAPFSGYFKKNITFSKGIALGNEAVATIVRKDKMHIQASIPKSQLDITMLQVGLHVDCTINGERYNGEIITISPFLMDFTEHYKIEVGVNGNTPDFLPGTFANITINLNLEEECFLVPENSIFQRKGNFFVWQIKNGYSVSCQVFPLGNESDYIKIKKIYLKEGDIIIVGGAQKISEMTKVTIEASE